MSHSASDFGDFTRIMALYELYYLLTFYPRDAMLARSLRQRRVCPSVRLSVRLSLRLSHVGIIPVAERKQDREMYTI